MLVPFKKGRNRDIKEELNIILQKGFSRILQNGEVLQIEDVLERDDIYELFNSVDSDKHKHSTFLVIDRLIKKDFVGEIMPVETNIIIFEVTGNFTPKTFVEKLKENEILASAISPTQVRMVLHLDVSEEMVKKTINVIENLG